MNLGILCSGNLGYKTLLVLHEKYPINFVFTDVNSKDIIEFCDNNKLSVFIGNPRGGKAKSFIDSNGCDLLISINYLFLIEKDVINMGKKLTFNIHGSLLPKYRGRTPHVWSIINGEKQTGITAHIVDEGCDTGDVLEQIIIPIDQKDTGAIILKKYEENYLPLLEKVIYKFNNGTLQRTKQNSELATYFGKRVPEDGLIDWNWQKERIYNWIRAQAHPYPGAYTAYEGKKLTIDRIMFSDYGFDCNLMNGTILKVNPLIVKTPNGAIELITTRESIDLKIGDVLK
ncbi:methionyl-tRNA formyltransferase [Gelidibacter japonicus]|uniref:methionyl-tRNA formyltransferase n=1 Tax=Gelidibacter japonicus TaxID=1962232 RepID=UPI0020227D86|nr:methionyl-tRNA formyltransferase [Gelidibacter japonicus]MCL8006644.1 methionyl-tRNA formyltransferase [Gelidibacter japonicus]